MKNNSGDGIICDYCSSEKSNDFEYFSYDFYLLKVLNKFKKTYGNKLSCDLCSSCNKLFRDRLLDVAEVVPTQSESRCDVSGENMGLDDHDYYKCKITRVSVSISDQDYICEKCGKNINIDNGPCSECNNNVLIKNARVDTDNDYLELNFSEYMFNKFKNHIEIIKNSGDNKWK